MHVDEPSTFSTVLRDYWHPVVRAEDVKEGPYAVTLLDERLVLFRSGGQVRCFQDLCIHRGTPLSLGWVDDGNLVCAYHGWAYGADGGCVRIPALPPEQGIPRKAKVPAYRTQERYGLIWVCLGEPKADILAFPEYDDARYRTIALDQGVWEANAARIIENFMDVAHFAWIHDGVLGVRSKPYIPPPIDLSNDGQTLRFKFTFDGGELPGNLKGGVGTIEYATSFPFSARQTAHNPDGTHRAITLAICPISTSRSRRFFFMTRDYDLDGDPQKYIAFQTKVSSQDQPVVESQRPWQLPVDLTKEMHVRGPDTAAVAYREMLSKVGIDS
jgi:phenylpropionate dioxygenase-like ring-hydroxylating dioxygenase large terminal subunit